jgi:hypothetical protein
MMSMMLTPPRTWLMSMSCGASTSTQLLSSKPTSASAGWPVLRWLPGGGAGGPAAASAEAVALALGTPLPPVGILPDQRSMPVALPRALAFW